MRHAPKDSEPLALPVTCPALAAQPGVAHGFFTRGGGVSAGLYASLNCGYGSGDDITRVAENRALVAESLHVAAEALCTPHQTHSARVAVIGKPWHWSDAPEADAVVTATPGLAVGVLTADCVPVLLTDAGHRIVAAAHAGWKGAHAGIIEATLDAMTALGAALPAVTATLGPAIARESYEVGPEFHARFAGQDAGGALYFTPAARPEHYLFDLKAYVKNRLRNAGVADIRVMAQDTCAQEEAFFSFRRATLRGETAYGRQISAIALS